MQMEQLALLSSLTADELLTHYVNLFEKHKTLLIVNEENVERILELKCNLETATERLDNLEHGLEQFITSKTNEKDKCCKPDTVKLEQANSQQNYENSYIENGDVAMVNQFELITYYIKRVQVLEQQNGDLLRKLRECQQSNERAELSLVKREKNIANLKDKIYSLEEHLEENYYNMKNIFKENGEFKPKYISICKELSTCRSIFYEADITYVDKFYKKLLHLKEQCEQLQLNYHKTLALLGHLSNGNDDTWLNEILHLYKIEIDDLKSQLLRIRLEKATLEEQLCDSEKNMACYRFERLKHRCALLDRENILLQNNIKFKPTEYLENNINQDLDSTLSFIRRVINNTDLQEIISLNKTNLEQNKSVKVQDTSLNKFLKMQQVIHCRPSVNEVTTANEQCDKVPSSACDTNISHPTRLQLRDYSSLSSLNKKQKNSIKLQTTSLNEITDPKLIMDSTQVVNEATSRKAQCDEDLSSVCKTDEMSPNLLFPESDKSVNSITICAPTRNSTEYQLLKENLTTSHINISPRIPSQYEIETASAEIQ